MLTGQDTYFTFSGNGLVNSGATVCIAKTFGKPASYLPASYQSGNYSCRLPASKAPHDITMALSLNGVHEVGEDFHCNDTRVGQ